MGSRPTYGPGTSNYHAATDMDVIQAEHESRQSFGSASGPVTVRMGSREQRQHPRQHKKVALGVKLGLSIPVIKDATETLLGAVF